MKYLEEEYTPQEIEAMFTLLKNVGMEEPTTEDVLALNNACRLESCLCTSGRRAIWYNTTPDPNDTGHALYVDTLDMLTDEEVRRELM